MLSSSSPPRLVLVFLPSTSIPPCRLFSVPLPRLILALIGLKAPPCDCWEQSEASMKAPPTAPPKHSTVWTECQSGAQFIPLLAAHLSVGTAQVTGSPAPPAVSSLMLVKLQIICNVWFWPAVDSDVDVVFENSDVASFHVDFDFSDLP